MPPPQALTICKRALKLAKGARETNVVRNATTDASARRLSFYGCPGTPNDRTIGPEACRGMRAAPIVARVATAPPTLQTVGMVAVSGGQARGGGNGKRGGGRLVGGGCTRVSGLRRTLDCLALSSGTG